MEEKRREVEMARVRDTSRLVTRRGDVVMKGLRDTVYKYGTVSREWMERNDIEEVLCRSDAEAESEQKRGHVSS